MTRTLLRIASASIVASVFQLFAGARADTLDTGAAIIVDDEYDVARKNELVTLPFSCGESAAILATTQLRIVGSNGLEIPAQWRVLTRWKGAPTDATRPIRFALAHFLSDLAAGEAKTLKVYRRKAADPPAPVANPAVIVNATASQVTVTTGPARYEFSKLPWMLFGAVTVDLDGDGVLETSQGERVMNHGQSVGSIVVDPFGHPYVGAFHPGVTVTIEESGPLRAVLRVDGRHEPFGPGTIGRDYLKFSTRYTFTARSAAVRVEHTISNSYLLDPLGAMGIGRCLLHARLDSLAPLTATFGGDPGLAQPSPIAVTAPKEVYLLQDSPGGAYWNQPGTTFKGWCVWSSPIAGLAPETLSGVPPAEAGDRAAGWLDLKGPGRGLLVALRYPWQNYPYALRALHDGSVVVDLLPSEHNGLHWLDDGQRKTWDLLFEPHGSAFDPALVAWRNQYPLRARPALDYVRETKAWGDQGDIRKAPHDTPTMIATGNGELKTFYATLEQKASLGWMNFGEYAWAKSTHSTASPRNRLTWFDRWLMCGGNAWFERAEIFALHSMDLRTYHLDGFKTEQHPNAILQEGMPAWPGTDMLGRDQITPGLAPWKAGIPANGHGWNGFDSEHMTVDDLYEYYLVTGSRNALDAMKSIGEGMLTWKHSVDLAKPIPSSRVIGWVLRSLVQIHQVTGDPRFKAQAAKIVTIADTYRGKQPSPVNGIVYHYLARYVYGGGTHGMIKDYEVPWQMGVGIYGLGLYYRETGDPKALNVLKECSAYIADYCVLNGFVVEALECDKHTVVNPKDSNDGVNMWLTSALALAYRYGAYAPNAALAGKIFDENDTTFLTSRDNYHWFHTAAVVLSKDP